MIGTRIRGFRHLIRMAKTLSEVQILFKHDLFSTGIGVALYVKAEEYKNPYISNNSDYIMIFNDYVSNMKYVDIYNSDNSDIAKKINTLRASYPQVWVTAIEKCNFNEDSNVFSQILAVPRDFEQKYSEFCKLNKKQMANITSKYVSENSSLLKYFFAITNGSKNFFFWAVNAYFKQSLSIYLLEKIMNWNDSYSQLSNKLLKNTITGYTNLRDIFALVREMSKLRRDKRANDVINMFNTAQKKALKGYSLKDRDYDTLSKFGKLSFKKKNNFIRKMSTIDDPVEILKQMSFLADVHFEWKKESLLDFIKNSDGFKCSVVIDKGDMVLLKVDDYETVKRLAKTTNWCISKDKKYWYEYVENNPSATQYVLMDFSKKEDDNLSIVGFTSVHDRGITNAHDFQNKNLMHGRRIDTVSEIKSFVPTKINCSNIYGVLDKYGIKLSDVVSYEPNQYKWDRDSMFEYLNQCVDEEDYYIIYDDGVKIAFIVESDNIRYFLGDTYIDQRASKGVFGNQHIIFADFSKKENDPEKLVFGVIIHNFEAHESTCSRLYNDRFEAISQSFDSKLEEYGLPYDIICRKNNAVERFFTSLSSLELATAKDLIKNDKVKDELFSQNRSNLVRDAIINVTFGYMSSDYIDMFYNAGYRLSDVIGEIMTGDIVRRIINSLYDTAVGNGKNVCVPSLKDIKDFNESKITDYNKAFYVGYFSLLMKMLDKEVSRHFIHKIIVSVLEKHYICDLFDLLMTWAIETINIEKDFENFKNIVSYAYNYKSYRVIKAINLQKNVDKYLYQIIPPSKNENVETTEIWVKNNDGVYTLENINEEAVVHSPRRR